MNQEVSDTASSTPSEWTIDQLAQRSGVIVSTIRLYQNRGLLPPPTRRGRVGYYSGDHLDRLEVIAEMQRRGYSLAAIKELLEGSLTVSGSLWSPETPRRMSMAAIGEYLGYKQVTADDMRRVVRLGLATIDGADFVVLTPSFLAVGRELLQLGLSVSEILDEYEALRDQTAVQAKRFAEVFRRNMWSTFVRRGMTAADAEAMRAQLERLANAAERVSLLVLREALRDTAEAFVTEGRRQLGRRVR